MTAETVLAAVGIAAGVFGVAIFALMVREGRKKR